MSENAQYKGRTIKIGTCENLYYLRADQRHLVTAAPRSVDVHDPHHLAGVRFRFPFPDEDHIEPGAFQDYDRTIRLNVEGLDTDGVKHYSVQFKDTSNAGLLVSLPCPESKEKLDGVNISRNGYPGNIAIVQQAFRGEDMKRLVLVVECGSCGAKWSIWNRDEVQPILDELERRARFEDNGRPDSSTLGRNFRAIAERIAAGYEITLEDALTAA